MGIVRSFPDVGGDRAAGFDTGGGGGDDGGMESRVAKLEAIAQSTDARLTGIERDIAVVKSQIDGFTKLYASKADVSDAKNSIIMWVVSAVLLAQVLPALLKKFGI